MNKSFTLIELLMIMAILALIIGMSIPTFSSFKNQLLLNATAQRIASDLRKIQSQAYSEHKTLSLDPNQLELPSGIRLKSGKTISFSPSGSTSFGGSGSLLLQNQRGQTKKIIVSTVGRVRVE